MKKVGAYLAIAAFALIPFAFAPTAAFGLRIGPFHLGIGITITNYTCTGIATMLPVMNLMVHVTNPS
jgi:hypothetical protein